MRRPLLWRLVATYLVVILALAALVLGWSFSALRTFLADKAQADLAARAELIRVGLEQRGSAAPPPRWGALAAALGESTDTRVTFIALDGAVLGDSEHDAADMENHATRPEVQAAVATGQGSATRYSETLGHDMLYSAVLFRAGLPEARVVRVAFPLTQIDDAMATLSRRVAVASVAIALLSILMGSFLWWPVQRHLRELSTAAEHFSAGELDHAVPGTDIEELSSLGMALSDMASQLNETIGTIERERFEREAVFSCMVEGVVAVDTEKRILSANGAAARVLGDEDIGALLGRPLSELIRDVALGELVDDVLETSESGESELALSGDEEIFLQVHGSLLRGENDAPAGVVLVLNDVTRLRRLELVRREFVANVSHELRTPVTSIKGFVETLLDGAMDEPDNARRFLTIIGRQAERLHAIVEDLLTLSRLEHEAAGEGTPLKLTRIIRVLESALDACGPRAEQAEVHLSLECGGDLRGRINPALLEQAVINLVDNAIKHVDAGGHVDVSVVREGGQLVLAVKDDGCGIPVEHQARLFERFYRVDRARSRAEGGTGLGLAIVKHAAQVHGGSVSVASVPNEGATFRFTVQAEG